MKFLTKTVCLACGGSGRNQNPAWLTFKRWQRSVGVRTMLDEARKRKELGLSYDGPDKPTDTCPDCQGKGEYEKWMELDDILRHINHPYHQSISNS